MQKDKLEKVIKLIDTETAPPRGLKEKILSEILIEKEPSLALTSFEKFIFEKPLRAALAVSVAVSGTLWIAMGKGFSKLIGTIIG